MVGLVGDAGRAAAHRQAVAGGERSCFQGPCDL